MLLRATLPPHHGISQFSFSSFPSCYFSQSPAAILFRAIKAKSVDGVLRLRPIAQSSRSLPVASHALGYHFSPPRAFYYCENVLNFMFYLDLKGIVRRLLHSFFDIRLSFWIWFCWHIDG